MTTFNKTEFQQALSISVEEMLHRDDVVNQGQMLNFLQYFAYVEDKDMDISKLVSDESFGRSLRTIMIFATLALSLHDTTAYAYAIEVFPIANISPEHASLLLQIVDHIQSNPLQVQSSLESALADPLSERMALLKHSLYQRFADSL